MQAKIGATLASVVESGESFVLSEIGVAERLYGAYKLGSAGLESRYLEVFANSAIFEIVPVDGERLEAAARLGRGRASSSSTPFISPLRSSGGVRCFSPTTSA